MDDNEEYEGFTLIERYRIFEDNRSRFTNVKAIIGSGMNPADAWTMNPFFFSTKQTQLISKWHAESTGQQNKNRL
ncbi:hypothetical protein [Paenibacillus sediminis]|uniref:Uncharacterized protein n=1 Tax=Paenibacillus sediminis TaxID=664909 RepID=A0ABS4H3J4_9BACL|nr:hypothetical protein [Paenibacillus sediminis]MBP1937046.1 hypothetical protein [Paenibacillus sediminis]